MGFADLYLSKQKGFSPYITGLPSERLRFIIVIPVYCEPDLTDTLESIWNCQRPLGYIEVIVVVNSSEKADPETLRLNMETLDLASGWIERHQDPTLRYFMLHVLNIPEHVAGVGYARKTGMDEAVFRFNQINNPHGFILSFDADSLCDPNYFTAIEESISRQPAVKGFDVYFEHPVSGSMYPERVYSGIIEYEMHLRYVNLFLRFIDFPFAFHTVGSCFGVRADIYTAQGGMNKRKAGEDFYFLQKIIPLGQFIEINCTRVIPSPRESGRVPFGTGTAISKYLESKESSILTYSPDSFLSLGTFFRSVDNLYKIDPAALSAIIGRLSPAISSYLKDINLVEALAEINANSRLPETFLNRFYRWFDAFRVIKFLNYASRSYYPQVPVREAVLQYLAHAGIKNVPAVPDNHDLLMLLREIERNKVL